MSARTLASYRLYVHSSYSNGTTMILDPERRLPWRSDLLAFVVPFDGYTGRCLGRSPLEQDENETMHTSGSKQQKQMTDRK